MENTTADCGFYTIGDQDFSLSVSPWSAALARVMVPDRNGRSANVTMGFENADSYRTNDGGGIIMCPNGGRIKDGILPVCGKIYRLTLNGERVQLHGGSNAVKLWEPQALDETRLCLTAFQQDGTDGWPGNRRFWVTYTIDPGKRSFRLTMEAESDKPTYVNMGSHAYWNLSGDFTTCAFDHFLKLNCSRVYLNDCFNVAERAISVEDTPYDFRTARPVQQQLDAYAGHPELAARCGYDNAFVFDTVRGRKPDIEFYDPKSGRRMTISTDAPAAVIYSGGGKKPGQLLQGGVDPCAGCSIAFECQDVPNTPNNPGESYHILKPGQRFIRNVVCTFDTL